MRAVTPPPSSNRPQRRDVRAAGQVLRLLHLRQPSHVEFRDRTRGCGGCRARACPRPAGIAVMTARRKRRPARAQSSAGRQADRGPRDRPDRQPRGARPRPCFGVPKAAAANRADGGVRQGRPLGQVTSSSCATTSRVNSLCFHALGLGPPRARNGSVKTAGPEAEREGVTRSRKGMPGAAHLGYIRTVDVGRDRTFRTPASQAPTASCLWMAAAPRTVSAWVWSSSWYRRE